MKAKILQSTKFSTKSESQKLLNSMAPIFYNISHGQKHSDQSDFFHSLEVATVCHEKEYS